MVTLPAQYEQNMRALLGDEFDAYLASFDRPVYQGARVNTAKISVADYAVRRGIAPRTVDWCRDGFYIGEDTKEWSKHPDYYAGLYYLQEPSAMAPAAILPIAEGDRVLDLCAAPGGKSTQLCARLKGTGLLVSNDISASRAKALLKNLELFGSRNSVVLSEAPYRLAERFEGFFDKVLVDAPCSGEGMFHKEPAIMKNWAQYGNDYYAKLQRDILPSAVKALRPGGLLLYSTCTFAPLEDEQSVEWLLEQEPGLELIAFPKAPGIDDGHPEWSLSGREDLRLCARFWPHKIEGQGHFVALFRKKGGSADDSLAFGRGDACPEWDAWRRDNLTDVCLPAERLRVLGDKLFLTALPTERLNGLRVLRNGIFLGELSHGRFEPTEAFAMTLSAANVHRTLALSPDDIRVTRYLKGETLTDAPEDGWYLVLCGGYPLGWAKATAGLFKNKYLKAWKLV